MNRNPQSGPRSCSVISLSILVIVAMCSNGFGYYQAEKGRWMSRDPIDERGGRNLYGFLRNVPQDLIDAYGLAIWSTSKLTSYHGSAEASTPYFTYYPSYINSDDSGPGTYVRPAASVISSMSGAVHASIDAHTLLKELPWYLPGVVEIQMSNFLYGKLKICGCCKDMLNVRWMIDARITASGRTGGPTTATAAFGDHKVDVTPSISPQTQSGTDMYSLPPPYSCIEIGFNVGQAWVDYDNVGSGVSARSMIVAYPYCANKAE